MSWKMHTTAGVWMDHRKAVIVMASQNGEIKTRITSSIEKQLRRSGRSRPRPTYKSRGAAADNSREREYRGQPEDFYDEIIACIAAATTILIFGPGEAKNELQKRIEQKADAKRTVRLETTGEMADDEIVEKVRKQFRTGSKPLSPTGDNDSSGRYES